MKKLIYFTLLISGFSFGQSTQQISASEYNALKLNGQLNPSLNYEIIGVNTNEITHFSGVNQKSGVCDCMIPLDSNFVLAMLPNDDESTPIINLPFSFSYYGNNYNSLYINNNGNISFLAAYNTFEANPFPDPTFNMIAPFWGDVDTRGAVDSLGNPLGGGGEVWYKLMPSALIVKWEQVGYFPNQIDKLNTFQLTITNGIDSIIPNGDNISFCYGDMQWGKTWQSSTVGVNYGNGVDFFQIGRFDSIGTNFDGPYGADDQIDFLDGLEAYFDVSLPSGGVNVPPMLIASGICDTIDVYTGDTLVKANNQFDFSVLVTTPEANQEVFATVSSPLSPLAVTYSSTTISQEAKRLDISINATGLAPGLYELEINAIDNGLPTASSTNVTIPFRVIYDGSLSLANLEKELFSLSPNPVSDNVTIHLNDNLMNTIVEVTNISGETVLTKVINETSIISLDDFSNGIYLVRLTTQDGNSSTQRLVKK